MRCRTILGSGNQKSQIWEKFSNRMRGIHDLDFSLMVNSSGDHIFSFKSWKFTIRII